MSAKDILHELTNLSPSEIAELRRGLDSLPAEPDIREIPGTGKRAADYESLFGALADDPNFEIPERHPWRPMLRFD